MNKLSPLVKGIVTSIVMLIITLALYFTRQTAGSSFQYFIYAAYAGGILWTLFTYSKTPSYGGKFGELFNQGFRCFIIVTLVMVAFTGIFSKLHPEMAEESASYYKEELIKKKNKQMPEIEKEVEQYKNQFTTALVSTAIFGYLITGAFFTAAGAGLILMRRK